MAKQIIVDLTTICPTFPRLPQPLIERESMLDTFDDMFAADIQVIVIEGKEGIGKTTLLAQYALRYPQQAVSLFIKPTRLGYDPQILQFNLCNQINWIIRREELSPEDFQNNLLQIQLNHLIKIAKKHAVLFVVDGLSEIPQHDRQIRREIIEMLPLGYNNFRFVFSGALADIAAVLPRDTRVKQQTLAPFSLYDTIKYFGDIGIQQEAGEELYRTFRGIPGNLTSVRRAIASGTPVDVIIGNPSKAPDLFEYEWKTVDPTNQSQLFALAILAFDPSDHDIDSLAHLLDMTHDQTQQLLMDISLIEIRDETGHISFVSETYRRFVSHRLRDLEREVDQLIIDRILKSPVQEDSLRLPDYLHKTGQISELLAVLSTDHFIMALSQSRSVKPLQRKAELGIQAAQALRRDPDLARLSISRSVMKSFETSQVWRSEVQARMSVGDYTAALALAQQAELRAEHLHALAVVARYQQEHGGTVDPALLEQIELLCTQVDTADLEEKSLEIASDLLPVEPKLALALVESATKAGSSDNSLDWSLAQLSIDALQASNKSARGTGVLEKIRSRIEDPLARQFAETLSLVVEDYSAIQVLEEIEKLSTASDQVFVLRSWAQRNREAHDALDVVEQALRLIVRTTDYAPNARVLRELATPLVYANDVIRLKKLVLSLDGQKNAVEHLGPTEDFVRLQLILAHAEMRYDKDAARNRLVETYFYVNNLDDLTLRVECLARLDVALDELDQEGFLEKQEDIHETVQVDVEQGITQLLETTGDHYFATRGVVRALSKRRAPRAIELARSLNIEFRRDMALRDFISSHLEQPLGQVDFPLVHSAISAIVGSDLRDESLLDVWARLNSENEAFDQFPETLRFVSLLECISDARQRCNAYCLAYNVVNRNDPSMHASLLGSLLDRLQATWESINSDWEKIETGHRVTEAFAEIDRETARRYLDLSGQLSRTAILDAPAAADTYLQCVRLLIRTYSGLLRRRIDSEKDLDRLDAVIDFVPSSVERVRLWSEVALRMFLQKRVDDCRKVVDEHITPLLEPLLAGGGNGVDELITVVAPILYVSHPLSAINTLERLSNPTRDQAFAAICEFLLTHRMPSDPASLAIDRVFDIAFDDILNICAILERVEYDAVIGFFAEAIADTVTARSRDRTFSRQQRIDIANRLAQLSDRLPLGDRGIRHVGFKVMVEANRVRIYSSNGEEWARLIESARHIANISDRVFVLGTLASYRLSNKILDTKSQTAQFQEAIELVDQIPSLVDRIDRYEYLATLADDPAMRKKCLQLAMQAAIGSAEPEIAMKKRNLVDLAYQSVSEEFAASLASLADDDPARLPAPSLQNRLTFLGLKRKMANDASIGPEAFRKHIDECPSVAWALLGDLNAGKLRPLQLEQLRGLFPIVAQLPIEDSYPIAAFIIENAVRRLSDTDQARTILRPMFESMLLAVELTQRLVTPSAVRLEQIQRYVERAVDAANTIVSFGDRDVALKWIENWFAEEVNDHLIICDQYFSPQDLHILLQLRAAQPTCRVSVLTSLRQQKQTLREPWNDYYRDYWRTHVSHIQDPPETDIIVLGTSSGKTPIHDRWWLTKGAGLNFGTSLNSLGYDQVSEISRMSRTEVEDKLAIVEPYLRRSVREHRGEPLTYARITLP